MDSEGFESALEVRELFPLHSGYLTLEINTFHKCFTINFYPILFHFYTSCPDQPGIRETSQNATGTGFKLQPVT